MKRGNFDGIIKDLVARKVITKELSDQLKNMILNYEDQEGYILARDFILRTYYEEPHEGISDSF